MALPTTPPPEDQNPQDPSLLSPEAGVPMEDTVEISMPKELLAQLASIFQVPEGQDDGESVSIQIPKASLDELVEILSAASEKAQGDIDAQGESADLSGLGAELDGLRGGMNR